MTGQRKDFQTEYRELVDLCEKYQMDGFARELRESGNNTGEKPEQEFERIRSRVGDSLKESLELFYENKRIFDRALEGFNRKVDEGYAAMKERLLSFMDGQYYELGRDQALTVIWLKCGNNLTVYGELFSYQIRESGVKEVCEELIRSYSEYLRREVQKAIGGIRWFQRSDTAVEAVEPVEWGKEQLQAEGDEVYLADDFLFRLLQTANSYGFGNAVRLLPDARLLQKAIDIGQKALMWYLDSCSDQCNKHLMELYQFYRDSFREALTSAFQRETGRLPGEILGEIRETELDMTRFGLYGDVPYYPLKKDGGLEFIQSLYYVEVMSGSWDGRKEIGDKESGGFSFPTESEICEWAKTMVFEPYFAERMGEAKSRIYEALFSYNGSFGVTMPLIAQGAEELSENKELERICPFFHKISWGKAKSLIREEYKGQRREFREWCALRWDQQCREREREAKRQCLMFYQEIFEREIDSFVNTWRKWRGDVAREPRMQESSRQAALNLDAFTYYQWYYYPVHPAEHTLRFLFEFRQTGRVSVYLTRQVHIVDTRGETLVPEMAEKFKTLFEDYLRQMAVPA